MATWRNRILELEIGGGERNILCMCGFLWEKGKRLKVELQGCKVVLVVEVVLVVKATIVLGFGFK
jgi:hypothetical protein